MDPKANLAEQRDLVRAILAAADGPDPMDEGCVALDAIRLAELVSALDAWRRSGGFDPYASEVTR